MRIAPSEFVKRRLLDTDPDDDGRIVVLPHAVPDPWVEIDAVDVDLPSEPFVLYAGRLTEEKGARLLVEALDGLGSDLPFVVTMAGDGPLREWVQERASVSGGAAEMARPAQRAAELHRHMRHASGVVSRRWGSSRSVWSWPRPWAAARPFSPPTRRAARGRGGVRLDRRRDGHRPAARSARDHRTNLRRAARGGERWHDHFSPAERSGKLVEIYRVAIKASA